MVTINIKSLLGATLFSYSIEDNTISKTLNAYFSKQRGNIIEYIDLSNQEVTGVDFSNITFVRAKLSGLKASRCKAFNATFQNCDLDNCILSNSNLFNINLKAPILTGSSFINSSLSNIYFHDATFDNVTLKSDTIVNNQFANCQFEVNNIFEALSLDSYTANSLKNLNILSLLDGIKADFLSIINPLSADEKAALKDIIIAGQLQGNVYEGINANLIGTIAKIKGVDYKTLNPNFYRSGEIWFLLVNAGETPQNNSVLGLAVQWIEGN